jgi:hypothetical protein
MSFGLQGCNYAVPTHQVGNWRGETDYLLAYEFIPPGSGPQDARLNSCSMEGLSQTLQCNGRGICKPFDPNNLANPINFCECDPEYADPECRTERKSQAVAYVLSLFFGFLGVDQFYLGFPLRGAAKLCSLGGLGLWWLVDIVNIGSAPVYAAEYRVSANLPHWAFVLSSISFAIVLGFLLVSCSTASHFRRKRKNALLLQAEEEARQKGDLYNLYSGIAGQNFNSMAASQPHPMTQPTPSYSFGGKEMGSAS